MKRKINWKIKSVVNNNPKITVKKSNNQILL